MAGERGASWRSWRRSRPFWGGLLLALAGLELIGIPLSGVLSHGAVKLVIYIGIGGVFGVLIGVLLIACGVAVCVNPGHRMFYGVAGVLLGILSFPASNLGGFFIGLLLAIVGGSIAFAWTPLDGSPVAAGEFAGGEFAGGFGREPAGEFDGEPGDEPGEEPTGELNGDRAGGLGGRAADGPRAGLGGRAADVPAAGWGRHRQRMLAVAAAPLVLLAGVLGAPGAHSAHSATAASAAPAQRGGTCILFILCFPSPTPTPSGGAGPGPSGSPSPAPSPGSGPGTGGSGRHRAARRAKAAPGLVAATAASVIKAGSATLDHLAYQGPANMPVAGGGTVRMMKFTATSITLASGVTATVTQNRVATVTTSPTLGFGGGVVLYATQLSGCLGLLCVTLTPDDATTVLLQLASGVTGLLTLTLSRVTTDQPLVVAGSLQTGTLKISFG
jgi:hypothetical protein